MEESDLGGREKSLPKLSELSEEELLRFAGSLEVQLELEKRWSTERFGVKEVED